MCLEKKNLNFLFSKYSSLGSPTLFQRITGRIAEITGIEVAAGRLINGFARHMLDIRGIFQERPPAVVMPSALSEARRARHFSQMIFMMIEQPP